MSESKLPPRLASDFDILDKTTVVGEAKAISAEDTIATHAVVKESRVDILFELERRTDIYDLRSESDRRILRVKVWSEKKPGLNSSTCISVAGRSQAEMARACEFAAAALAERQCGLYGDTHNVEQIARDGRRHFDELCQHLARAR